MKKLRVDDTVTTSIHFHFRIGRTFRNDSVPQVSAVNWQQKMRAWLQVMGMGHWHLTVTVYCKHCWGLVKKAHSSSPLTHKKLGFYLQNYLSSQDSVHCHLLCFALNRVLLSAENGCTGAFPLNSVSRQVTDHVPCSLFKSMSADRVRVLHRYGGTWEQSAI
jgi:hypothetical protein